MAVRKPYHGECGLTDSDVRSPKWFRKVKRGEMERPPFAATGPRKEALGVPRTQRHVRTPRYPV